MHTRFVWVSELWTVGVTSLVVDYTQASTKKNEVGDGVVASYAEPVTLAAAAVTLFTTVATKGITEIRRKSKTLAESDWCFIYELNKRRLPFSATRRDE